MTTRPWILVCVAAAAACGAPNAAPPPRSPSAAAEPSLLLTMAERIDPGAKPRTPLRSQLPLEIKAAVPSRTGARATLDLAREHAAAILVDGRNGDAERALRGGLIAVALAEQTVDSAPHDVSVEASAFLVELLYRLSVSGALIASLSSSASFVNGPEPQRLALVSKSYQTLGPELASHMNHHLARVLRAGAPEQPLLSVLWFLVVHGPDRLELTAEAMSELRRIKVDLSSEEQAALVLHLAARDNPAPFVAALPAAQKKIAAAPEPQRRALLAKLLSAQKIRKDTDRLIAASSATLDERIECADLLRGLDRHDEADRAVEALEAEAPSSGRVRARVAHSALRRHHTEKGIIVAAGLAKAALLRVPITAPHSEDARMLVGVSGVDMVLSTTKLGAASSVAGADLLEAAAPLRTAIELFAARDPDGGAGLLYASRALSTILRADEAKRASVSVEVAERGFSEIVAMRKRLPKNTDVIRLVHVHAARVRDKRRALDLVLDDAGLDDGAEPQLAIERVDTAATLIAATGSWERLPQLRASLEAMPAVDDDDIESARLVSLADVTALEALAGDRAKWARAASLYGEVAPRVSKQAARLRNNEGYARAAEGDRARARELYERAQRESSDDARELAAVAFLNGGLIKEFNADFAAEVEARLTGSGAPNRTSALLLRWLAGNSASKAAATRFARRAIADDAAAGRDSLELAADLPLVCEGRNSIGIGMHTTTLGYRFDARAACRLWLTDAKLPSTAALQRLAR